MAIELGKAYVQIVPSAKGISGGITNQVVPAADAAGRASLLHSWSLVLVHAGHVHPHSARSLGPQLDDGFRASLHTGTAGGTLLLVHDRKTGLGIHGQGSELTGSHTVPAAETSERAARVPGI